MRLAQNWDEWSTRRVAYVQAENYDDLFWLLLNRIIIQNAGLSPDANKGPLLFKVYRMYVLFVCLTHRRSQKAEPIFVFFL